MKNILFLTLLVVIGCEKNEPQPMLLPPAQVIIEDTTELKTHLAKGKPVVVDFYASWCVPCHNFEPEFKQWAEKHPEAIFVKVDIDKAAQLAKEYGVEFVPNVIVIKDTKVVRLVANTEINLVAALKSVQ
jgi:thiol-disulfide isomerase/thioredoxin